MSGLDAVIVEKLTDISGQLGGLHEKVEQATDLAEENKGHLTTITGQYEEVKLRLDSVPEEKHKAHHEELEEIITERQAKKNATKWFKELVAKVGVTKAMGVMIPVTLAAIGSAVVAFWKSISGFLSQFFGI